jgi:WD40 repeat protein
MSGGARVSSSLSFDSLERIDRVCSQFEDDWRVSSGVRIENYLDRLAPPDRPPLFLELLRLDVELLRRRGETPDERAYGERFPDYRHLVEAVFQGEHPDAARELEDVSRRTADGMHAAGYEILETVGRGGMAVVYKARHVELDRLVALKVILAGAHSSRRHRERFRAEARVVARFQHPNIIHIHEVGEADGVSFLALEFAEGGNLQNKLAGTPQDPRSAAELVETLARAAQYAHERGIVHRDLKPANVLLTPVPKIADFGLAKQLTADVVTHSGEILGTASYMAPEQAAGNVHDITPATDVYALGAVLYEMLSGRPPFKGSTVLSTIEQVATQEPIAPSHLQRHIPRDLETVCLKCLEKDARKRYGTAAELADDLRRFLDGQPVVARPAGAVERAWKLAKRRPVEAALTSTVLLVALLGLGGIVWQWSDAVAARAVGERERDSARRQLYRANVAAAASAIEFQDTVAARLNLESAPEEYRNWEWRHLYHQLDHATQRLAGHTGTVVGATFSPDGSRILSFSEDHTLRLWDVASGNLIAVLQDHTSPVSAAVFTPDGARVASAAGSELRLWNGATGALITAAGAARTGSVALAISPDGTCLLGKVRAEAPISFWTAGGGQPITGTENPAGARVAVFSPDGKRFATGGARYLRIWSSADRSIIREHRLPAEAINVIAFSPDGSRLVSGSDYPSNKVRVWNVADGALLGEIAGHENVIESVAFSPDGLRIASASLDQTVRLWDATTFAPIAVLRGHTQAVLHVQFNPRGTRLATASADGSVRLWDAATGESVAVLLGHTRSVGAVVFSPDGTRLLSSSSDKTIAIWDAAAAERKSVLPGHTSFVYDVAFSRDGSRLASAAWDGTVRIWNARTGRPTAVLKDNDDGTLAVAFSPADGNLLATGNRNGTLKVWDLRRERTVLSVQLPGDTVNAVDIDKDGKRLIAALGHSLQTKDSPRLWLLDLDSGERMLEFRGHTLDVEAVQFSPDGRRIVSGGLDGTIRMWDSGTGEAVGVLQGHESIVRAVAFNPSGSLVASASDDRTIRLWDASTFREISVLPQASIAYALAFLPDGSRLAAGYADSTIGLWDPETLDFVGRLRGHESYVHGLDFSPDGTRLASASGDFTVRIWEASRLQGRR